MQQEPEAAVTSHPQSKAESDGCLCWQFSIPSQGMVPPTVDRPPHLSQPRYARKLISHRYSWRLTHRWFQLLPSWQWTSTITRLVKTWKLAQKLLEITSCFQWHKDLPLGSVLLKVCTGSQLFLFTTFQSLPLKDTQTSLKQQPFVMYGWQYIHLYKATMYRQIFGTIWIWSASQAHALIPVWGAVKSLRGRD